MSDYHGRIMNLQIDKKQGAFDDRTPKEILAYKAGHRDARHAAAELIREDLANGEDVPFARLRPRKRTVIVEVAI